MPDSKLSNLAAASALTGTELFYADTGAADVKVTANQISAFVGAASATITAGVSPIGSGTDTRVVFDDGGKFGEDLGLTYVKATGTLNATILKQNGVALGTAAFVNTGTSGATIPLLSAANTWTLGQTFSAAISYGGVTLTNAVTGTGKMVLDTSPTLATPTLGIAAATSLALGGATIGANALAVTGSSALGNTVIGAGSAITSSGAGGALGTAAFVNTGTSGGTVPLLNATNTFATGQIVNGTLRLGTVSSVTGQLLLGNSASANLTTIQAGNAAAACTYTWPTNFGAAGTVLTDAAGNGTLSWGAASSLTVNSSAVSGGSAGNLLYTDGSLLQASGGITWAGAGQLALALGTITTNLKAINITGTWNAAGTTFDAPLFMNITPTASAAASLYVDIQNTGNSVFQVGNAVASNASQNNTYIRIGVSSFIRADFNSELWFGTSSSGLTTSGLFYLANNTASILSTSAFGFTNSSADVTTTVDTKITRGGAAATLQHGAADAAAPVAQTVQAQSVVAGTSNTAGADWIKKGSRGTGTGVGGKIRLQTAAAGLTGTAQNAATDTLTLDGPGNVVVGNAAIATNATDGFIYLPTCAGTPTGTPTAYTGRVAMVYDTTNHKLYIFDGAWKGGTNPGAFT